jgi:hypothetical protein
MRDRINDLLELMGFPKNTIQVFDKEDGTFDLLYPNFFSSKTGCEKDYSDEELLDVMITLMIDHQSEVKSDFQKITRFRKSL